MTNYSRSRGWILTISAQYITLEDLQSQLSITPYSWIFQLEKADSGFNHFQLYIESSNPIKFDTLKKLFPNAHIEPRKGNKKQAWDYCSKEDTRLDGPYSGGPQLDLTVSQGRRNDLIILTERILEGVPVSDLILDDPNALRHSKHLDRFKYELDRKKYSTTMRDVQVTYIHGPTGSGKTKYIYDNYDFDDVFRVTDYSHPFDGYNSQPVLVLDEFHSQLTMSFMLNLLDRYPLELPCRFVNKWASFTKVYIISNLTLQQQYENLKIEKPLVWDAFARRISEIKEIS